MCDLFGKTRQAYYKSKKSAYKNVVMDDLVLTMVKHIRERQKRLGCRKMYSIIMPVVPEAGKMGRDAFFDLLRSHGLLVRKRRTRVITTNSYHWLRKYPNLIRETVPTRPNQVWVSDITYIKTAEGFVYLFLITDAYSRKIIGWQLSDNMESINALIALKMANRQRLPGTETIHHSDRGVQYCCAKYVKYLNKANIGISMTENGDPYENAIAERVNGILKTEWLYDTELKNYNEALKTLKQIIYIYNNERPHLSIGMLTPNEAHLTSGELKKLWKSYHNKKRKEEPIEI